MSRPYNVAPILTEARVALVHRDFAGTGVSHVGLGITAAYTAKTLRHAGIWAEVWSCTDAAALLKRIRHSYSIERPVTHVVISAPWIQTPVLQSMALEFPNTNFVVVSHSSVGFLAADPSAIRLLRETADLQMATHNVYVGGNSRKFTDWATQAWKVNAAWLPNLYNLSESFQPWHRPWHGASLNVGMFGANRPLKNFLSGAAAAVELHVRLRVPVTLHMSSGRNEGGNMQALKEMTQGIPEFHVVQTGWLAWPAFRRMVRHMHLVLQPSYTETFNVVTADAVIEGVPVVVSDAIDWVPTWWRALADEPMDIARVAEQLLRDPNAPQQGRRALEDYVANGLVGWKRFLAPGQTNA